MTDLHVDFVATQNNGDVLTHTLEIPMPVGDVFVGDTRSDIKHDDPALALDVVAVAKSSEFLLPSRVPDIEADGTKVGMKC